MNKRDRILLSATSYFIPLRRSDRPALYLVLLGIGLFLISLANLITLSITPLAGIVSCILLVAGAYFVYEGIRKPPPPINTASEELLLTMARLYKQQGKMEKAEEVQEQLAKLLAEKEKQKFEANQEEKDWNRIVQILTGRKPR